MSEKQFVHLHVHTDYSALDGASKIGSLVDEVHRLGQPAVAITDHGNAQGAYELWKKATEKGINPIVGQEFYVAPGGSSRHGRERIFFGETRGEDKIERSNDVSGGGAYTHMTMWAETTEGMHNLFKLSSYAFLEGRFGSNHAPRIDDELISQYGKGIIATTGCPSGEIQTRLRLGQWKEAVDYAAKMQDILGKENYFLELMDHGLHIEKIVRDDLLKLSDYLNIPKVATNDTHYTRREDAANHDHMLCIQTGSKIDDEKRFRFDGDGYYIKSAQEMRELFKDFPDACDNTLAIAERCHVDFTEGVDLMPKAEVPEGMTDSEFLEQEVIRLMPQRVKGWNKLPEEKKEEYKKRGIYECSIISQMGFPSYFLVVGDFVQWAKNQGIAVGPGRGSAGGCLVAYIMSITDIDPIKHNLIFERFLNPERVSMPDIDIDFDDKRRGEVIAYVTEKYGEDKVSQIVTFGLIKAKAALKDASRILDNPYALGDILSKKMPEMVMGRTMTLKGVYDPEDVRYPEAQEFRDIVEKGTGAFPAATMKEVVEVARGLEGYIRQTGIHAAGVIMSSKPLMDTIPLMLPKPKPQSKKKKAEEEEGDEIQNIITTVTQFDYPTCETLGLLKMDFLGLRNLTIITDAFEYINKNHGITMTMEDLIHSNLDDKKTYRLLQRGDSLGVFQLDGCLAGNTLVSGRTISSLYDRWVKGDKLSTTLSYNLADGTRKRNKVLNIVQSGIKPVYRLVTESGRIVEATADHRFMTNNGWKKLGEIDVSEDQVIVDTTVKTRIHRECIDCQVWLDSEQNNSNERCYKCSATFHSNPSKPASREAIRRASLDTYKTSIPKESRFESIDSITYVNEQMTYDISMEAPLNNFLANGVMVHNSGMRSLLKSLRPTEFNDISAVLALYRPGPMGVNAHMDYADRKNGRKPVVPIHKELEEPLHDILGETYELVVFQEQIMQIAQTVAGYSLGGADLLRRAMGKKKKEEMDKQYDIFLGGMKKRGYSKEAFESLWNVLLPFADYAFNKCVSGDTEIMLGSGGSDSNGYMKIEDMYNRLHVNLLPPSTRWEGQKHTGPCLHCKREDRPAIWRGRCKACKSWWIKFRNTGIKAMSLGEDGRIRPRRIKDVHYNGEKEAFKITLSNGSHITATADHRHMTSEGWKQVIDLRLGDLLITAGETEKVDSYSKYDYRLSEGKREYRYVSLPTPERREEKSVGYIDGNFIALKEWTSNQEWACNVEGCDASKEKGDRIERAHLDGNRKNNSESNLMMMCVSHHKKWDYQNNNRNRRGSVGKPAIPVEIISIEPVGVIPVYDLEMESEAEDESLEHSWVGNGIVTHNSHSDGYALLSYVTAYLKAHYPAEYMAALLTSVSDKPDQTALYLNECRKMGIEVLPPDIRKSKRNYDPQGKQIVFGLGSIRGLGEGTVEGIVETRKTSDYDSIASLLENFPADTLNKKVFDGLIHSGALDGYGFSRRALEKDLIASLPAAKTLREEKEEGSMSLFDAYEVETPDIVINDVPEYTKREKLALERHMLGLYVSDHPLSNMGGVLEQSAQKTIAEIHAGDYTEGETTRIAGVITQVENKTTKKGDPMQIVTVEDMSSEMTVLVFAKTIQSAGYLQRDTICQISGTLRKRDDEDTTMMVSAFSEIEIDEATGKVPFWLKFRAEQLDEESATELQSIFKRYPGDTPVFTSLKSPDGRIVNMRLGNDLLVRKNPAMAQLIMEMFGSTVFGKWNS